MLVMIYRFRWFFIAFGLVVNSGEVSRNSTLEILGAEVQVDNDQTCDVIRIVVPSEILGHKSMGVL